MKPPLFNGADTSADTGPAPISAPEAPAAPALYSTDLPEPNGYAYRAPEVPEVSTVPTEPVHNSRGSTLLGNLIFLLVGSLITYGGFFIAQQPDAPAIQIQPPPTIAPTATPTPSPTPEPMTIFISGAVQNPGLYALGDAARVGDALTMAGGLLADADASLINQAERLFDGAQIHVPMIIEIAAVELQAIEIQAGEIPADGVVPEQRSAIKAEPPAGISGSSAPALSLALSGAGGNLINVNSATAAQLETLPGVGASRAAEIIAGRPYATVDELQKVSGIGAKTVEKLRPLVTVD